MFVHGGSMGFLKAEQRDQKWSSGQLNKFRTEGKIPAVIYGKDWDNQNVFISELDFKKIHHEHGNVFEVEVNGKKVTAATKEVQWSPLHKLVHVSFHKLDLNKKTIIEVPIHLIGESAGQKAGGSVSTNHDTISIWAKPGNIPAHIDIDVTNMEMGDVFHAKDIKLPEGCEICNTINLDENYVICNFPMKEEPEVEKTTFVLVEGEAEGEADSQAKASDEINLPILQFLSMKIAAVVVGWPWRFTPVCVFVVSKLQT